MTFTDQQKQDIYKQINTFNNQNSDPNLTNSKPYSEAYLYVDETTAKDRASFVGYLLEQKLITTPKKVIDLAFGSGNLTSHLLLDNNLEPEKVVFNDKNTDKTNQAIKLDGVSEVTQYDFLASLPFEQEFDWVVFNPQIGGSYRLGDSGLDENLQVVISNKDFNDYLKEDLKVSFAFSLNIDEHNKRITITASDSTHKTIKDIGLDKLKAWNYYDICYQAKSSDLVTRESNIIKLRKNLDAIVSNDHCVIFLGEEKHFKILFADYPHVYRYMAGGKDLFVASKTGEAKTVCYEHNNGAFVENTECKRVSSNLADLGSLEEAFEGLTQAVKEFHQHSMQNPFGGSYSQEWQNTPTLTMNESPLPEFINSNTKEQSNNLTSDLMQKGSCDFPYKNILLKGVPGTGKSRLLELIIEKRLQLQKADWDHHVLRVNIHSASSNADLMQGIAVSANEGAITYSEKRGLIFDLICRACQYPNQPFVLILEEVQENSLNELIGDLIYLIEDTKRAKLSTISEALSSNDCLGLVEAYVNNLKDVHYVKIPNLVSLGEYRKMILPANLYVFCTSNYRDDKKIIEDNLLRRFEVIDLYPRPKAIKNQSVSAFLEKLNDVIVEVLEDEIHPDRFQIGHAIWMNVSDEASFATALYKTLIELKEIREIQPSDLKKIFDELKKRFSDINANESNKWLYEVLKNLDPKNPVAMIHSLQGMAYQDLMTLINDSETKNEHSGVSE